MVHLLSALALGCDGAGKEDATETTGGGAVATAVGAPEAPGQFSGPVAYDVRPLYSLGACDDHRFPRLSGRWALGCSSRDRVDLALDLSDGTLLHLREAVAAPAVAPGLLLSASPTMLLWRLPGLDPETLGNLPSERGVEVVTDGRLAALAGPGRVERWVLGDNVRARFPGSPERGQAPALAGGHAFWVDHGRVRGEDGEVLGEGRGVVGDGGHLAWVEAGVAVVRDVATGMTWGAPMDTGFEAPISLWGGVVCGEDRSALRSGSGDIGVVCSDLFDVDRVGDQRWPSRSGPWLLFREGDNAMVATARTLFVGAGVVEADGRVRYRFDWPAPGWRWEGEGEGGELGVGEVEIVAGEGVRLLPGGA